LIEADGKSLFYSGDFRLHGRSAKNFDWFCNKIHKKVDYLLLEGSTIGRTDKSFPTEDELEEEFVVAFKQTKGINLVYVSGQNIDRLISIYNACRKCNKIFLIDFYTANVLKTLSKKTANNEIPFPSRETYPEIKVYYPKFLTQRMIDSGKKAEVVYPFTSNKIGRDKLDELADKLVMLVRPSVRYDLEHYLHKYRGCFIYSMWNGYKTKPGSTKDFLDFINNKGMPIKDIHTSGHADLYGLKRMVETVKPKYIVPIHTFESERYTELFKGTDVVITNDKEEITF
jgi:ribonuclease J